ncbi:RNA/RNP complex-1-interacting phosphatase [Austrofundulus limnaeus]|uniref:RNA/RNP complex-1-interacting phosphatase n=1 Tax=Austrofundulus limnaeus TaxID=52670 RepID=A0A2I4ARX2_AUSLI|nr:PREDICTED: RNA/RNP complex-1-interacting phosphatase-like [Austrofundulus limnaeus]
MSRYRKKKNDIPDRWLDYVAVGKRLQGTRFIAFKVPLKQSLTCRLPGSDVFGPWELLDALSKEKQALGLIIDLTYTNRYYTPQDIPQSLLWVKIFTAGHEVPSDQTILSFKRVVHRFLQDNKDNDMLIGVHCTHGVNRTGYLISRYLIDVDGMDPEKAVGLFNSSRGHAIERQNYLDDLKHGPKRSNKNITTCEQEPVRGEAVHRPVFSAPDPRPHLNGPEHHRSSSPRGLLQPSHQGLFPRPPVLTQPPFHHPQPFNPYRWASDDRRGGGGGGRGRGGGGGGGECSWRRPPYLVEAWSGHSMYLQSERRPPSHLGRAAPVALPPYSPRWSSTSNSDEGAVSESWSRKRPPVRYDTNRYGNC